MRGHWHKLAALLMHKAGQREVQVTGADVEALVASGLNIVLDARDESRTGIMTIRLVDTATAQELARAEGGRPQDC